MKASPSPLVDLEAVLAEGRHGPSVRAEVLVRPAAPSEWLRKTERTTRTSMSEAGSALMGIGIASGEGRATAAARQAVSSPLLESSIEGATGILLNVTGGPNIGLFEVNEAAEVVTTAADQNANVIFGAVIDDALGDEVKVTVIATGFGGTARRRRRREPALEPAGTGVESAGGFDMPRDVLDVPPFLRDN